jgi:hypothetical protein
MWPYWILFGFFAAGALLARPDLRRSKPLGVPLLFGALAIVIFVGLRYKTGTDWGNYQRQWVEAESLTLDSLITIHNGDAGFYTLMWLLKSAGAEYWVLNLICAAIFTFGLFAFAKRLPNPWLAIAVAVPYLVIVIAMLRFSCTDCLQQTEDARLFGLERRRDPVPRERDPDASICRAVLREDEVSGASPRAGHRAPCLVHPGLSS